ncbi:MAG: hypothetical protein WBK95_08835 [Sulfurimonas sp.]|jgi:ribosomal protein S17E|nr:hypothetical protein [Sulfurimonas sp.]MDD3060550.1 hypothetical protein [Sulfurimonas sp.]MDD5203021.1 hypothetical protein [Sulfurimonas sp.]
MDLRAFENLELIPKLLNKIEAMEERLKKFTPALTTKKEVAKFLNVTSRTVNNYIANGYLKENYHFKRKSDKILVFIEEAILEFRDNLDKGIVK